MPIMTLSCRFAVRFGSPVFCGWKSVAPAATRLTTMRLVGSLFGSIALGSAATTPYQRLPVLSTQEVGSQHSDGVSVPPPGRRDLARRLLATEVPGRMKSLEIHACGVLSAVGFPPASPRRG